MTSVTSGRSLPMPFARASCDEAASPCLRTWTDTGLLGLPMSLETLPAWGCLLGGELYELPTPALLTDASACSSLPTPKAGDGERGRDLPRLRPDESSRELATAVGMLPTPVARDHKDAAFPPRLFTEPDRNELAQTVALNFLPTPQVVDGTKMSSNPETWARRRMKGNQETLTDIVQTDLLPTPVADNSRGLAQSGTDYQSLPNVAMALLPTPTAQAAKHGETPDTTANRFGSNLWDVPTLLPTPTVMDMGGGRTPEEWESWRSAMKGKHQNGNGHGRSLEQELIGASTAPQSADGSASPDPLQIPLSPGRPDDPDCLPLSWSG